MIRTLYVLNTLKSNQLKAPFQKAKIAVSSGWAANRVLKITKEVRELLVALNSRQNWDT